MVVSSLDFLGRIGSGSSLSTMGSGFSSVSGESVTGDGPGESAGRMLWRRGVGSEAFFSTREGWRDGPAAGGGAREVSGVGGTGRVAERPGSPTPRWAEGFEG